MLVAAAGVLPLAAYAQLFSAADFGAAPNDGKDDRVAIQSAIDAALHAGAGSCLVVPPGTYDLGGYSADNGSQMLTINGAHNFELSAEGAEFIIRNPQCGLIRITDSDGVILRAFSVDYDPLPFTVGRVTSVMPTEDAFVMRSLPGYPEPDDPVFSVSSFGYFLDGDVPGRLLAGEDNVLFRTVMTHMKDGLYRIQLEAGSGFKLKNIKSGTLATQLARCDSTRIVALSNASHVLLEQITVYASAGGFCVGANLEEIRIENCQVLVRQGRLKGCNADGIHLQNARGPIVIRGNLIEGISDDCVNLYQKPHSISARKSPLEWTLSSVSGQQAERPGPGALRAGDLLHAYDGQHGVDYGRARLKTYNLATGVAVLETPWNIPDNSEVWKDVAVYSDGFGSDFTIENNTFQNSRRFGLYLKSCRGIVRNNRFTGLSSSAIYASNDVQYEEGGFCSDLLIESNEISNCGFDGNFLSNSRLGTITFEATKAPYRPAELHGLHRNITLRGNRITGCSRGFNLSGISGLDIEGSTFIWPTGISTNNPTVFSLQYTDHVICTNNLISKSSHEK